MARNIPDPRTASLADALAWVTDPATTREALIAFGEWNDPNGVWGDDDFMAEFGFRQSIEELREVIAESIRESA